MWTWGRNVQHQTVRLPSSFRDQWRILEERPALDLTSGKKWNDTSEMAHSPSLEAQCVRRVAVSLQKSSFILCNVCPEPMGTMRNFSMGKKLFPGTVNRTVCIELCMHSHHHSRDRQVAVVRGSPWAGTDGLCPRPSWIEVTFLIHYWALLKLDKDYQMPNKSTGLHLNGSVNLSQLFGVKLL